MSQFCDRNDNDVRSFLDGQDAGEPQGWEPAALGLDQASLQAHKRACPHCGGEHVATQRVLMDPIRLLETGESTPATKHSKSSPDAPPRRVWSSIEATLKREGLIS